MKTHRTVNQVLDQLALLEGQAVQLEGVLEIHQEGYELKHYPNAERRSEHKEKSHFYRAGVWVEFGDGSVRPNDPVLARWNGKRVRIYGVVHSASSLPPIRGFSQEGFGPLGFWLAATEPTSIQRVTAEERREDGA